MPKFQFQREVRTRRTSSATKMKNAVGDAREFESYRSLISIYEHDEHRKRTGTAVQDRRDNTGFLCPCRAGAVVVKLNDGRRSLVVPMRHLTSHSENAIRRNVFRMRSRSLFRPATSSSPSTENEGREQMSRMSPQGSKALPSLLPEKAVKQQASGIFL